MSYRVRIESFEGPFDLLLYLVSRQRVDIGSISITEIIDQYLVEIQHMKNLDLDVASDFLLVAATLLNIKAESLLHTPEIDLDDDIAALSPNEARDILVGRLIDYKQYKNAAKWLDERQIEQAKYHARSFGAGPDFADAMPDYLAGVHLDDLSSIAAAAYARREAFLLDAEHIAAKPIPVEAYVKTIHARIRNRKSMKFSDLVDESTPTPIVVVTFLALLELYKRQMIRLKQKKSFGDIEITYIEGSGELTFDTANQVSE